LTFECLPEQEARAIRPPAVPRVAQASYCELAFQPPKLIFFVLLLEPALPLPVQTEYLLSEFLHLIHPWTFYETFNVRWVPLATHPSIVSASTTKVADRVSIANYPNVSGGPNLAIRHRCIVLLEGERQKGISEKQIDRIF
jgi:hypothetical protein